MHGIKDTEAKLPADSSSTEATEDKEQVTDRQAHLHVVNCLGMLQKVQKVWNPFDFCSVIERMCSSRLHLIKNAVKTVILNL